MSAVCIWRISKYEAISIIYNGVIAGLARAGSFLARVLIENRG
jgi:hypothetical protein